MNSFLLFSRVSFVNWNRASIVRRKPLILIDNSWLPTPNFSLVPDPAAQVGVRGNIPLGGFNTFPGDLLSVPCDFHYLSLSTEEGEIFKLIGKGKSQPDAIQCPKSRLSTNLLVLITVIHNTEYLLLGLDGFLDPTHIF